LGKTVVAALVCDSKLRQSVAPFGEGERPSTGRIAFLAPTKPLAVQHRDTFMRLFASLPPERFSLLTGETDADERQKVWSDATVTFIFATPETVLNDARAGRASLKDFVLLIFDEAHRCVRDYSYTELARRYLGEALHPLILGLTASPGGSEERISEIVENLRIEKVEARAEEDADVREYVEETKVEWVRVSLPEEFKEIVAHLMAIYSEKVSKLKGMGFLSQLGRGQWPSKKELLQSRAEILSRLKGAERNSNYQGMLFGALVAQSQAVMVLHAVELAESQGGDTLRSYLSSLGEGRNSSSRALLRDERWQRVEREAERLRVEHPKLEKVKEIVREQLERKGDSKVIVFTQYRDTIEVILSVLSHVEGAKAARFVGQAARGEMDRGMSQRLQTEMLEKFREGRELNALVSSSIGEEGLHVPDVDLVVFYEPVPSEVRSIQRRGRTGRTMPGRVAILVARGTMDESYLYSATRKEKKMSEIMGRIKGSAGGSARGRRDEGKGPTLLDYMP
jgi:Fanconi anemia group M protein